MTCRGLSTSLTTLALAAMGCQRTAEIQCYPVDPHSPVVYSELEDPVSFLTDEYCGRGSTEREGLQRNLTGYCVPKPEAGCDPCMLDFEEVEAQFRVHIDGVYDDVGCPSDYEPEEIVHGCAVEWVETNECCWAGEYFTDPDVCDIP